MSISGKSVIICGGGLGGLTAAIALYRQCQKNTLVPPTIDIFESANSPKEREYQDYSISIRSDSGGVRVLENIGVIGVVQIKRGESKGFQIVSHNGKDFKILFEVPNMGSIRIPRVSLWKTLLEYLPKRGVRFHWGKTVVYAEQFQLPEHSGGGKRVRVKTADGASMEADLLIVSDGSRSNLREVLYPEEKLRFAETIIISGLSEIQKIPVPFKSRHGITLGNDGIGLFTSHETESTLLWALSYSSKTPRKDIKSREASVEILEKLHAEALERSRNFPPVLQDIVMASPLASLRVLNLYDKPPHASEGVIAFLGDSTHPVTPFSGNGANMAMVDAWNLATELTTRFNTSISAAVSSYNREMVPRTLAVVEEGRKNISRIHMSGMVTPLIRNWIIWLFGFKVKHPVLMKGIRLAFVLGGALFFSKLLLRKFF